VQNPKRAKVIATNMLALSGIMGIDLRSYSSALTSPGVETPFVSFAWNWEVSI
jgi:hypothetical protein